VNVLYLSHSCPYPPNKGDRIRNFHLLKHLAKNHEVTLIYASFSPEDLQHAEMLNKFCSSVKTVRLSSIVGKLKCCLSLLGRQPLTNAYFYSRRLQELIDQEACDLIVVDCSSMAQYVMGSRKPKIIDFVDVDSDKWKRYAKMTSFPQSYIYKREYQRLQKFEAKLVQEFDASIVVAEQEKAFLQESPRVFVVRNGIDLEYFAPRECSNQHTLIFTGAMNYFPNIDGVLFFCEEVFPLIKREVPEVKFIVGGMDPDPRIKKLESAEITVTGLVPDMREYMAKAAVCVVPLRIAKGIQNKVLEAMAMNVPVVSTSHANRGINARNRVEIMEADEPKDFAQAVVELLRSEDLRRTMAENARWFVEEHYSWDHNLRAMDEAIKFALNQQKEDRTAV